MNNSKFRIIPFVLPFIFLCHFFSRSQENNLWFGHKHALYVAAGYLGGKRIVSGLEIYPQDSLNQQIHVKLEVLENWIKTDSAEFDLFLDTTKQECITLDDKKYEAIQYRSKNSDVRINFEKPEKFEHTARNGMEFVYWNSTYATINYSSSYKRFKKYSKVLKVYFEK
jgi:hypothetical protein